MRTTIIVSAISSGHTLIPCLQSLCTQSVPADSYEVILPHLGNLSWQEEALLQDLRQRHSHLRALRAVDKNRSEAINEAIRESRGELLLFTESHCITYPDWVADYLRLFQDAGILAAIGQAIAAPSESWVSRCETELHKSVRQRVDDLGLRSSFMDFHNTAITRECLDLLGGLSPDVPMMAEFELGARLHQSGIEITPFPTSIVSHFNDTSVWSYVRGVMRQGMERARIMATREPDFVQSYFPSRRFQRLMPVVRRVKLPLLAVAGARLGAAMAGFALARLVRSFPLARFFFRRLADQSHLLGQLLGLRSPSRLEAAH